MAVWQRLMIALATSEGLKRRIQRGRRSSALATRFVGGADSRSALDTARTLADEGVTCSLFYLGEYVRDAATVSATVAQKIAMARELAAAGLDVHVSVDPTQIGYSIDHGLGQANADSIGRAMRDIDGSGLKMLMLDMEDRSLVDPTLALARHLDAQGVPVGVTLQAYLRRTEDDLRSRIAAGGAVRLVKGAFAEDRSVAFTRRPEIDENYLSLAALMLSDDARMAGLYPVFGTHDERMIEPIRAMARDRGWQQGAYEFEMLFGVRTDLGRRLRRSGEAVRVYLPFGQDWWPYAVRRVGESPRNARFLLRALLSRN